MNTLSFKLEKFEGPLDLLLHLISKHKLNIYDIEISLLLEQYLAYIDGLHQQDFELAGEFLEMAARLVYIKTVSLLPKPNEAEELKKELEGTLIEYSLCKQAAEKLKQSYIGGEIFVRNPVKIEMDKTYTRIHDPQILVDAYMGISVKERKFTPLKADVFKPLVTKRVVSVTSRVFYILRKLYNNEIFQMDELYKGLTDVSERVATFLAVLELTKNGRILISDDNTEITLERRAKTSTNENTEE